LNIGATEIDAAWHSKLALFRVRRLGHDPAKAIARAFQKACQHTLIDRPWKIISIARGDWAAIGHSI
jgi:hypothetical protein